MVGETETNGVTKIRVTKLTDIGQFACQSNAFISEFSDLSVRKLLVFASVCENVLDKFNVDKKNLYAPQDNTLNVGCFKIYKIIRS